jgi:hypothetical protein
MADTLQSVLRCNYPASVKYKAHAVSQQLQDLGLDTDLELPLLPLSKKLKRLSDDEKFAGRLQKVLHDLRVMRSRMDCGSPEDEHEGILALGEKPTHW